MAGRTNPRVGLPRRLQRWVRRQTRWRGLLTAMGSVCPVVPTHWRSGKETAVARATAAAAARCSRPRRHRRRTGAGRSRPPPKAPCVRRPSRRWTPGRLYSSRRSSRAARPRVEVSRASEIVRPSCSQKRLAGTLAMTNLAAALRLLVVGPYRTGPALPSRRNLECICSLSKWPFD